jgi:hypothetical protein
MTRLLFSAAIAAALIAPMAVDAAPLHRHKHHAVHQGRMITAPVSMHRGTAGPSWTRPVGPPWAGPNQCFEDLGYGRYESCDAGW